MATLGTYYFNGVSFATATSVYTDAALTILAPDGYYSNSSIVRQQLNGILLNAQPCNSCAVPCGSGVAASSNTNGLYTAAVDLGNSTGAVIIYGYYGGSIPDGQRVTYNGTVVNRLTCKDNHNGRTIIDGSGATVDYAGLNTAAGDFTYVGSNTQTGNLLTFQPFSNTPSGGGCTNGDQPENYVLTGGSYVGQGTYVASTPIVSDQIGVLTGNIQTIAWTMVVNKPTQVPTNLTIEISAPLCNTVFNFQVYCPENLPEFQGSALQTTTACAASTTSYFFARNAVNGAGNTFVPDTNTIPEIGNWVFEDAKGATYVNDTSTIKYIIYNNTTAIGIRNGVVVSSSSCT